MLISQRIMEIARDTMTLTDTTQIPDDIFFVVFHWAVISNDIGTIHNSLCPLLPPWTLASVCRRWRGLVLSTSTLWSMLSLPLWEIDRQAPEIANTKLRLFLGRSSSTLLDVVISEDNQYSSCLPALLTVMEPTTSRWRTLKVHIGMFFLLQLRKYTLTHLCRLDVTPCHGDWETWELEDLKTSFDNAMALRNVRIGARMNLPLVWGRIHSFTFAASFLSILPDMTQVEVLHIEDTSFATGSTTWQTDLLPRRHFPNLHTLHIVGFQSTKVPSAIKRVISAPALRTLMLDLHNYNDHLDLGLNSVANLSIHCNIPFPSISSLLSTTTLVTAMYLNGAAVTSIILQGLGQSILPHLESLRLDFEIMQRKAKEVVLMLEMRAQSSNLQSVTELIFVRRYMVEPCTVETLGLRNKLLRRWYTQRENMAVRYLQENVF